MRKGVKSMSDDTMQIKRLHIRVNGNELEAKHEFKCLSRFSVGDVLRAMKKAEQAFCQYLNDAKENDNECRTTDII